ncbi:MAG: glycosyltransferase family 2 protein [Promethearchaeota archaeon]
MEKANVEGIPYSLVMVAALNEEDGIGPTLVDVETFLDNAVFLVIDGRSTDGTVKLARATGAQVISQKGQGKGDAIATAIEHVGSSAFDYVVFIDADFTYPAEYLPRMLRILEKNPRVGMVCGNRFNDHFLLKGMHDLFYVGNRFLAFTHNFFNGVNMKDPLTGLRVVRWEIMRDWRPRSKGFDVEVEMNHLVERKGFDIVEIPIHYRERLGEKKLKLRHGFTILSRIFAESV